MAVENLFQGDERCETLCQEVLKVVYERGEGLPLPSVIGVLEIVKKEIMDE